MTYFCFAVLFFAAAAAFFFLFASHANISDVDLGVGGWRGSELGRIRCAEARLERWDHNRYVETHVV